MKHKMLFSTQASFALALISLGISGCKDLPTAGTYRGNIQFNEPPSLNRSEKIPVQIDLSYHHSHLTASVINAETHAPLLQPLTISKTKKHALMLLVPDLVKDQSKTFILHEVRSNSGHCYRTDEEHTVANELKAASLCFDTDNFNLEIQGERGINLYGTQFKPQREIALEGSQALTVSEGVERILNKNYDVQESIQSLLRANQNAYRAYLNFFPRTSTTGALKLLYFTVELLESEIEVEVLPINSHNLISFIFPGRWIKARELTWKARAEALTNTLFQINMGTAIQAMSVSLETHRQIRDELQVLQNQLSEALKIGNSLAAQDRLDANSIFTLQIALSDLNINLWQAQNQFLQDRMTLSQMMGFENPETIDAMVLEKETTALADIPLLNSDELEKEKKLYAETSLRNSFELRQLEFLHRAAVLNEKNMYIEWTDTMSTLDLGFKLIPQSKINKSLITSVEIQSAKTRQSLIAKAYNLVRDRNILRESFDIFDTSLKGREMRLKLLFDKLKEFAASTDPKATLTVQASDIRGSVRDVATGIIGSLNSKAALMIDQTELDRFALKGVYEKFLPQLGENEIKN